MTKDDLADRIEVLDGPDREIEAEIATAIGWRKVANPTHAGGLVGKWYDQNGKMTELLHWTASIDAAMTLVPDGFSWSLEKGVIHGRSRSVIWKPEVLSKPVESYRSADNATPALALVAAALRAQEKTDG